MNMPESGEVLVCGGAGYIGSHMCKRLSQAGYRPVVFDNLSTGHRSAVKWGPLVEGDLLDREALSSLFSSFRFSAVMHFAARSLVAESMREPALYYQANVVGTLNLLEAMRTAGVGRMVFSSTAAVYGNPDYTPIDEQHPCRPINPYGWSKLVAEQMIRDACAAYGLQAVALRYFNAAGADLDGDIGEAHDPETHLIPNVIKAALDPRSGPVTIFGDDYPTPDGTCIRDYVHVVDLCEAHFKALDLMENSPGFTVLNLGTGAGHSVREVLAACRALLGGLPDADHAPRRSGDSPILVADGTQAHAKLGFRPGMDLNCVVSSALAWHRAHHSGNEPSCRHEESHVVP